MVIVLKIIAVTVLLLVAQEALRRANRWAVWSVFFLLPLVLTPYWISVNHIGFFPWFKFYTVFFCVCWGTRVAIHLVGQSGLGLALPFRCCSR